MSTSMFDGEKGPFMMESKHSAARIIYFSWKRAHGHFLPLLS
jgi:hypothetical protein